MKPLALLTFALFSFTIAHSQSTPVSKAEKHILVVTGGHGFDAESFYDIFESLEQVSYDKISQPRANAFLREGGGTKYDALVFYDMWQAITPKEKDAYVNLFKQGKGMVFLHHSLVSYQEWDYFTRARGGKYVQDGTKSPRNSGYEHDIWLDVKVLDKSHPITDGLQDFKIYDEGYYNIEISTDVHPLLGVTHDKCAKYLAWTNEIEKSKIAYILLGHGPKAYRNQNYRQLIKQAIAWVDR